jgi:hypothetical protein
MRPGWLIGVKRKPSPGQCNRDVTTAIFANVSDVADKLLLLIRDTTMERSSNYQDVGKMAFKVMGACALLLFLFWNPLLLRPRFWNVSAVARSWTIDAILLVGGCGLIYLRKWAALLSSLLGAYVALTPIKSGVGVSAASVALSLIVLLPLLLSAVFWRKLVWGDRRRDPLFALVGVAASGLLQYVAFLVHRA